MKRLALPLVILAALALALGLATGGCGSSTSSSSQPSPTSTSHTPVTLTVWHCWTVPSEKKGFANALAGFHTQYPWITLKIVTFPDSTTFDQQVIKAVQAGGGPDVMISFLPDFVGQYAHDGVLIDLNPYLQRDNLSTGTFAPASLTYTQFEGKRVVLPVLTDAYGLYYNKDMFAKAGISRPAQDHDRAHGRRQEAHRPQPRRLDQDRRLRAAHHAGARHVRPGARLGRPVLQRPGPAAARHRPGLGGGHDLAEAARRLVRLRPTS